MPRIRNRIALSYSVLFLCALFVTALLYLQSMESADVQNVAAELTREAGLAATTVDTALRQMDTTTNGPTSVTTTMDATVSDMARRLRTDVYLTSRDGTVVVGYTSVGRSVDTYVPVGPADAPNDRQPQSYNGSVGGQSLLLASAPLANADAAAYVVVGRPLEPEYTGLLRRWSTIGAELGALFLLVALAGYIIARRLFSPMEYITRTTQEIADGDIRTRVPYWGQDEYGRLSAAINSLTSRLLQQMEDLSQEKSKIEGIIGQMGAGVLVVDRAGCILVANDATQAILDADQSLVGRSHWEVTRSLRISELVDTVVLKGQPERKEVAIHRAADTSVEVFVTPITGASGEIVGAVAVLHDVSQWRRVERMRTEFVANVSHELRTPITAVKGFAETLLDGALADEELSRQFVQIIHDESDRLSDLVNDLLELTKIESGHVALKFRCQDVSTLVQDTVHRLENQATQHGLTLSVHCPPTPVMADVAGERLSQVLINLIANSIAYTPSPGAIDVAVRNNSATVTVEVKDTGIGIPESDLPHVFERFYRVDKDRSRRTGGTGLGLAIVKHIMEAHRGKIDVQSKLGRGTTFRLTLPRKQPKAEAAD